MIYWVFGGTAVGKKRFIRQFTTHGSLRDRLAPGRMIFAAWMADGPCDIDLVSEARGLDLALRWQWGRDETMENICRDHQDLTHTIVLLSVPLITQLSRIALREGCLKWDAEQVHGEQRNIFERVHELSARYRLPVFHVDASNSDYTIRKHISCESELLQSA